MLDRCSKAVRRIATVLSLCAMAGCASPPPSESADTPPPLRAEARRANEAERALADRQRQCADEKRRLEGALRDAQFRLDSMQKKLNALLAIDRDVRSGKNSP